MSAHDDFLRYFDTEVRRSDAVLASAYKSEIGSGVRRCVGPFPSAAQNWIDWFDCDEDGAGDLIDAQVATYSKIGHSFRWKVYDHDVPTQMPDSLLERGFVQADRSALMVLEVAAPEWEDRDHRLSSESYARSSNRPPPAYQ